MVENTFALGIITPFMDGPYYGGLIYHIQSKATIKGIRLIVVTTLQDNSNYEIPIAHHIVDGWIVIKHPMNETILEKVLNSSKKVVGIGHRSKKYPSILLKNHEAMRIATEHLIQHEHRNIAFVGDLKNHNFYERYEGYKAALLDHDIFPNPEWTIDIDYNSVVGGTAAEKFIAAWKPGMAIVTCSDVLTMFVTELLTENGYKIPQDVAVIGFDATPRANEYHAPLTSVINPVKATAEHAFELLLEQLTTIKTYSTSPIYLDAPLVIKSSCGCSAVNKDEEHNFNSDYIRTLNSLEDEIRAYHLISNILASEELGKIYELTWLKSKKTKWACFAEWDYSDVKTSLTIISTLSARYSNAHAGLNFLAEDFPNIDSFSEEMAKNNESIIALFPIRSASRDWGILCRVLVIDESFSFYRPNTNSSTYAFVLLAAALERLQLFEENQRMSQILENVSAITNDGIWELDLNTKEIMWHTPFKKLSSLAINGLDHFIELIHPDDKWKVSEYFDKSLSPIDGEHLFNCEYRMLQPNHEYLWVMGAAKLVRDAEQKPTRIVGSIRDISERKRSEEKIKHMAFHDALTGLPNRSYFLQRIEEKIEACKDTPDKFAILLIDLDKFKSINDTYGHHMGDQVLKHAANLLREIKGPDGIVSRHGGDEFLMLIPQASVKQNISFICDGLIQLFNRPFEENGQIIVITVSIGYSLYPDDGHDLDALVNKADLAMYLAKSEGRNRYEPYNLS
jgi:diguanylate cyclase (GGDEF)-like protein/PAS domain S-box-containing protein